MKFLLIAVCLIKLSNSLEAHLGSCPTVRPMEQPLKNNLSGVWYDIMKYQSTFAKGKCLSFEVKEIVSSDVIISASEYDDRKLINYTRSGKVNYDGSLELDFTFLKFSAKFYILDTDYDNYLVGFGCKNIAYMMNLQMAFVWGREKELSAEYVAKVFDVLKNNKISTSDLEKSEQINCH